MRAVTAEELASTAANRPHLRVLVATTVHVPTDARILHRQIAAMTDAGWDVTYVAPWTSETLAQAPSNIRTIGVPRAVGRRRFTAARAARNHLVDLAPAHDVVLIHDPDLVPTALSSRQIRPLVWDVHEDTAAALSDRSWVPTLLRPLLRRAVRSVERLAERRCTLLLAEHAYQDRFRRPHAVVPNLPWARPSRTSRRPDDRVVYVGRLSRNRGLTTMLELGRQLRGRVEVVLIGPVDRDDARALEHGVQEGAVTWLGPLPNDAALREVEGAVAGLSLLRDVPNYRVSMPTKIVEYLAAGVPAITTPLPEAERIVTRYGAGAVVGFDDPDAAAEAVLSLAAGRDRWEQLSIAGFEAVAADLSWDRQVPVLLDALQRAAGR